MDDKDIEETSGVKNPLIRTPGKGVNLVVVGAIISVFIGLALAFILKNVLVQQRKQIVL
jgi:hypothetical protein